MTSEYYYLNFTIKKLVLKLMADIAPNSTNTAAAAQIGKGGGTIQFNNLATLKPTFSPEAERIAADQLRQSIEVSKLKKVLGIKVNRRLD